MTDWNSYTPEQKKRIQAESQAIYHDLVENMDKGYASPEVQQIIARWRQHLRYFHPFGCTEECTSRASSACAG